MRLLTLHPASLTLGLVLGGVALLSMSQAIVATSPLRIEYSPHPRDMVQISQGTPYTVPQGRLLVVTALGNTDGSGNNAGLRVNGQIELSSVFVFAQNPPSLCPLPTGFTVPAGAVVDVFGGPSLTGRAWGYLAPQ